MPIPVINLGSVSLEVTEPGFVARLRDVVGAELDDRIAQIDAALEVVRPFAADSWTALSALTGSYAGQRAEVDGDGGTHVDPVVGGSVPNSGSYRWNVSPAGWRWMALSTDGAIANYVIPTRAQANALLGLPAAIKSFRTSGWATEGDGGEGAIYVEVGSEPSWAGKMLIGSRWFELKNFTCSPEMRGAPGSGLDADSAADTAAISELLNAGRRVVGTLGKRYVLNALATPSLCFLDLTACRIHKLPGAACALKVTGTFPSITGVRADGAAYNADGTVNTAKCAASIIVSGPAANQLEVADASAFQPGMVVGFEAAGALATTTSTGRPREEGATILSVDYGTNVLTLKSNRLSTAKVGGKIIGDFPMIQLDGPLFMPFLENVVIQRCLVGLRSGGGVTSAGNASPIIDSIRVLDYVVAGIVQDTNLATETFDKCNITGEHTCYADHVGDGSTATFVYKWNVSPRNHLKRTTATVNGSPVAISSIDDAAGTVTLAVAPLLGDAVRISHTEFATRGLLYKGVGGSVNSMGRFNNSTILGCAVGVEIDGGVSLAGNEYLYGAGNTVDTCSFAGLFAQGTAGILMTGWSFLFAPYPVIFGADIDEFKLQGCDHSLVSASDLQNPADYPNRFVLQADSGSTAIVLNCTRRGNLPITMNVPSRFRFGAYLHQVPHAGIVNIASGEITVSGSFHRVQGAPGSTVDLHTIHGLEADGAELTLISNDATADITIKNGTGNIRCGADFLLSSTADVIKLIYSTSLGFWICLSKQDNA